MLVDVLKPFPFSRNGIAIEQAVEGPLDLPEALVTGLETEGYVTKAEAGAPENKLDNAQPRRGRPQKASG